MNGPEHYREAQRLLSNASFTRGNTNEPCTRDGMLLTHQQHDALIARAQVHATLALAAAQSMTVVQHFMGDSTTVTEWAHATGYKAEGAE